MLFSLVILDSSKRATSKKMATVTIYQVEHQGDYIHVEVKLESNIPPNHSPRKSLFAPMHMKTQTKYTSEGWNLFEH